MLCVILKPFATAIKGYGVGEKADFSEKQAGEFIRLGYVKPVGEVDTASVAPVEEAVEPAPKRRGRPRKG